MVADKLPLCFWPNDVSHPTMPKRREGMAGFSSTPVLGSLVDGVAALKKDASMKDDAAGCTDGFGRSTKSDVPPRRQPAMVANFGAHGGYKVIWPQDIRW